MFIFTKLDDASRTLSSSSRNELKLYANNVTSGSLYRSIHTYIYISIYIYIFHSFSPKPFSQPPLSRLKMDLLLCLYSLHAGLEWCCGVDGEFDKLHWEHRIVLRWWRRTAQNGWRSLPVPANAALTQREAEISLSAANESGQTLRMERHKQVEAPLALQRSADSA